MSINVITGPAAEPLTLAQALTHLRITDATNEAQNAYVTSLIKAARQTVERTTSRVLVTQTIRQTFNGFPACSPREGPGLVLMRQPVQSIVSVDYTNAAGQAVAWVADQRQLILSEPARVQPAYQASWPYAREHADSVAVTYIAGFGGPADVPELAKVAIRLLLGHWFENREEVVTGTITAELPRAAKSIMGLLNWGHYE